VSADLLARQENNMINDTNVQPAFELTLSKQDSTIVLSYFNAPLTFSLKSSFYFFLTVNLFLTLDCSTACLFQPAGWTFQPHASKDTEVWS
jgi:hypothetical protein